MEVEGAGHQSIDQVLPFACSVRPDAPVPDGIACGAGDADDSVVVFQPWGLLSPAAVADSGR